MWLRKAKGPDRLPQAVLMPDGAAWHQKGDEYKNDAVRNWALVGVCYVY